MQQEPVQYEAWISCTDAVGRERQVMVAIRGGRVMAVAPPGGTVSFGPDQLEDLESYIADLTMGAEVLRLQRPHLKQKKSGPGHPPKRGRS